MATASHVSTTAKFAHVCKICVSLHLSCGGSDKQLADMYCFLHSLKMTPLEIWNIGLSSFISRLFLGGALAKDWTWLMISKGGGQSFTVVRWFPDVR